MLICRPFNTFDRLLRAVVVSGALLLISTDVWAQQSTEAVREANGAGGRQVDVAQAKSDAERWLSTHTLAYVQISPASLWFDHPLRSVIAQSEPFLKVWNSRDVLNARTGLLAAEWAAGMKLETFLRKMTAGGVYAAIDADARGIVILTRSEDSKWLQRTLDKLLELARSNQANKDGQEKTARTIESSHYRGFHGYKVNNAIVVPFGPWLMLSNRSELAKSVLDRHLDGGGASLAEASWRSSKNHGPTIQSRTDAPDSSMRIATAEIDLSRARLLFSNNDLFRKQAKDFGAELLLGGILSLLYHSPSGALELRLEPQSVLAEVSFPTEMNWFVDAREYYVGPQGQGRSLPKIELPGALASLATYRNLSELWLRAGDLFEQPVNDSLAQADNTLTTLFSGRDFGSEILGAIEPELRMVAVPQAWGPDQRQPALKLPAFALIARLKEPESMRKELRRIFQSFIGFLNVVGAMEGKPQFDLMSESLEDASMVWGEYVIDKDRMYENGLPIEFNFSPSLAFVDDHVVLASSSGLARELMTSRDRLVGDRASSPTDAHTALCVHGDSLRTVLLSNRENLIAQNILEKGHSRHQAENEVDLLLSFLEWIDRFELELAFDTRSTMRLRVDYR